MAKDATGAYGLAWPPARFDTCAEAYAALRYGKANGAALSFVQRRAPGDGSLPEVPPSPYGGGAGLARRSEASYGAAVLLRAGGASERQRALALANAVVRPLGPGGGLLLHRRLGRRHRPALRAVRGPAIDGGSGNVPEVDGAVLPTAAAAWSAPARSASIRRRCRQGSPPSR